MRLHFTTLGEIDPFTQQEASARGHALNRDQRLHRSRVATTVSKVDATSDTSLA
jgi:hypothetical protein